MQTQGRLQELLTGHGLSGGAGEGRFDRGHAAEEIKRGLVVGLEVGVHVGQLGKGVLSKAVGVQGEAKDCVDGQVELGPVVGLLGQAKQDVVLNILTSSDECIVQNSLNCLVIIDI